MSDDVATAAAAIRDGEAVVYPTETVYGLGADATNAAAVQRVYELKGRAREKPLSMAVPSVERALEFTHPTEREVAFMREFLPGPVTVVVERDDSLPDVLTSGRDRVGIRIPDHETALDLLDSVSPITATSANRSGAGSVTHPNQLDPDLRERVGAVLDAGQTPGTESTVVDPGEGVVHRRGAHADAVEAWLAEH